MERRSERIFGQRYGCRPVRISDLNLHLMCVLCSGYYIDATTIIECLHSFCRSCIVRYLETSSRCPICDVLVHKAQPLLNIRVDHVLQGLVYKLVPGLLTKEMNNRREFYSRGLASRQRDQNQEEHSTKTQSVSNLSIGEESQQRYTRTPSLSPADSESLSISLEYLPSSRVTESRAQDAESRVSEPATNLTDLPSNEYADIRYLLCPAGFTVGGLKKFIRAKFDLPLAYQIDIFHGDECLENHFSMLDVAFIFQWQKKAPLHLRYSVSYVPRTKRKLTTTNSTRRQNSKENETHQNTSNKNGDENGTTSSQQESTISHPSFCPSKTSKHANSRTKPPIGDDKKSALHKDSGSTGAKRVDRGVNRDGKSPMSSRGGGSGHRDTEEGEQPTENPRMSATKDDRVFSGLTSRGNTVSKGGADKAREKSDERIEEFQEMRCCDHGSQTREESGQSRRTGAPQIGEHGNIVYGTSESAELTIDLTGDDLSYSVATQVDEMTRSGGDIPSGITPESVNRVVGSVTFVGNGSATVLSNHKSVLCNVNSGDITKPAIALPCINAFKTLSCGLHNHLGYASSDTNHVVGDSVVTDDVVKIMSSPEVAIVPSFGIQLIYSPDSLSASHNPPICGMIQIPETPVSVTSDAPTRAPTWGHSDVATNGIMNDADFQRLCEGKSIHAAEKSFSGCFEHFVMPNLVGGVGGVKMASDEMPLGYAVALDSSASGSLPCVFVTTQGAGHHPPQNSWGLLPPESGKDDAEAVDWEVCYPVTAAELGAASLTSISDGKCLEEQPECSFVCVAASNTLPGSATVRPAELWSQGLYADRNGAVETQPVLGSTWPVESRQCEPRAVKMCIVEPQAVKRKAGNDWAVEPKEARTSYTESIVVNAEQRTVEIRAAGNNVIVEETQAVGMQTMGAICAVENVPEMWAVEPKTMEPAPVEPKAMGSRAVERKSMKAVMVGLETVEVKTMSSCVVVESSPVETLIIETEQSQTMLSKPTLLKEPNAVRSATVVLQAGESQTVDAWVAEESLVEPDDMEQLAAATRTYTLEQSLVEPDDVEPDDVEPDDVEPDDVEPVAGATRTSTLEQSSVEQDDVEPDDVEPVSAARTSTVEESLLEPDDVEPAAAAETSEPEQSLVEPDEVEPAAETSELEQSPVEPDDVEPVAAAAKTFALDQSLVELDVVPDDVKLVAAERTSTLEQSLVEPPDVVPVAVAAANTSLLEHLEPKECDAGANYATTEVKSHDENEPKTICLGLLPMADSDLTVVVSEETAGLDHQQETSILQRNPDSAFLTTVSEDSGSQRETVGIGQNWEEIDTFHQNQCTVVAVDTSADYVVENAIHSEKQIPELQAEEKYLFSGDDLAEKFHDAGSTEWAICSDEVKQSLSTDVVKKDLDFESTTTVPKAAVDDATVVHVKTEDVPVSQYSDNSLSLEIEAVRLSAKPENISCKVEGVSVSLEEVRLALVVDMVEQNPVFAKVEDLDGVDNVRVAVDTPSTSYSHLSSSMLSPPSSETMFCSPEATELLVSVEDIPVSSGSLYHCSVSAVAENIPVSSTYVNHCPVSAASEDIPVSSTYVNHCPVSAASEDVPVSSTYVNHCPVSAASEDIPVSSTSVNHCPVSAASEDVPVSSTSVYHCPVSAVETGVLLADDGMLVSVMDDHVMVCIRDEEPVSIAEEHSSDEVRQTENATEIPVSDDDDGIPVLESSAEIPGTCGSERTLVSDACNGIPVSRACSKIAASDDCSMMIVSDDCSKMIASDDCSKMTVSDDYSKMIASDDCSKMTVSDDCSKMIASDDCSKMIALDECSRMIALDECSKVFVSDPCYRSSVTDFCDSVQVASTVSEVTDHTVVSDADKKDPCVSTDILMLFDDTHVPNIMREVLMPCVSNDSVVFDATEKIPVSDVLEEISVSDVSEKIQVYDVSEEILVPDGPENIPVSDVREEEPIPEEPEQIRFSYVPEEGSVSDTPDEIPVSDAPEEIRISDVPEEKPVSNVPKDIQDSDVTDQEPVSDVREEIRVSDTPDEIPVSDVTEEIRVSDVPQEIPVSDVTSESELATSSSDELPISVPNPSVPITHSVLTEDVPVSLTPSLETAPFCPASLETTPFRTSTPVESIVYHPAINSPAGGCSDLVAHHLAIENQVMSTSEELDDDDLSLFISTSDSEVSEVVPVSEEYSAVNDINLRAVVVVASARDAGIEQSSERLDCTEEGEMMSSTEESLVTDDEVLCSSSFPLDFGDGEFAGGGSDQNVGLHDVEDLGMDRVPGCEAEVIGALVVTDDDQRSVESRVDMLPSGESMFSSCVEKREEYVDKEEDGVALSQGLLCSGSLIRDDEDGDGDKEEDGVALSQRLLCSGSFIHEDDDGDKGEDGVALSQRPLCSGSFTDEDERHDSFRSITRMSRSFSFSNSPQGGSLDCAVPSDNRRRRSRSLDKSAKQALQSVGVQQGSDFISLNEKTASRRLVTDELLDGSACGNQSVARSDISSVPDEPILLNRGESFVGDVPVSSFRIQPFIGPTTKMQGDTNTVVASPVNDVINVNDEHTETCKIVATDKMDFCDAGCDDLKSNDCVLERRTGETELGDERPVNVI